MTLISEAANLAGRVAGVLASDLSRCVSAIALQVDVGGFAGGGKQRAPAGDFEI